MNHYWVLTPNFFFFDYQRPQSAHINGVLFQLVHLLRITSAHANMDKNRKTTGDKSHEKTFYWYLKGKKNPHIYYIFLVAKVIFPHCKTN